MLFNSFSFLLFFPIVIAVYYVIPKKCRQLWLLICSYYFYMSWNASYALLLLFSTAITYICGLLLQHLSQCKADTPKDTVGILQKKKICVGISLTLNLLLLFTFK